MSLHNEIEFEIEICEHLAANGWLYSPNDDGDDRARALFPEDVLAWVQETQPKAWEALAKNHGTHAADTLLNRLRDSLDRQGTLAVLRKGIDLLGLQQSLSLAEFKPALCSWAKIDFASLAMMLTLVSLRSVNPNLATHFDVAGPHQANFTRSHPGHRSDLC
jgi:type I restriction enzyme R subunit